MFGIVVRVALYDPRTKETKVFAFDERMAATADAKLSADARVGSADTNARIAFHTTQRYIRESWLYANVDLYNLDDVVRGWIHERGAGVEKGELKSRLNLRLDVGWSNFGENYQTWTLFDGSVNSYFVERLGRDDVHHFWCGALPAAERNSTKPYIGRAPQSAQESPYGEKNKDILKRKFSDMLWATGKGPDGLGLARSPTYEEWEVMRQSGQFFINIECPTYDRFGTYLYQDPEIQAWLQKRVFKQLAGIQDFDRAVYQYLASENLKIAKWRMVTGSMSAAGEFLNPLVPTSRGSGVVPTVAQGPLLLSSNPQHTPVPTWLVTLQGAKQHKVDPNAEVPTQNIIVNFEMLTQDPCATDDGVQITSLMRPWINVVDYIKLAVLGSKDVKKLIAPDIDKLRYSRAVENYTSAMSGAANEWMAVWGTNSAVFTLTREMLEEKRGSMSFLNVPLQVCEVQHIGDTHGDKFHSQIKTYGPGMIFGG